MIVEVNSLVKNYGNFVAVKGISLNVDEGEIFGLIGPNGAGKTTTLRIVATLLKPTSGEVKILSYDVSKDASKVRKIISYLPEEAGAYRNLRGIDYLKLMAELYADTSQEAKEMIKRAVEISGLGDKLYKKISTYSKGMTRKLLLSRALMHKPKLAILDEPTSGLDVINSLEVRNMIRNLAREGVSVLLSSHNMLEVEYLCDRISLIHNGVIVETGRPEELKKKYGVKNLEEVFAEAVK